jgi:hypothetical protein
VSKTLKCKVCGGGGPFLATATEHSTCLVDRFGNHDTTIETIDWDVSHAEFECRDCSEAGRLGGFGVWHDEIPKVMREALDHIQVEEDKERLEKEREARVRKECFLRMKMRFESLGVEVTEGNGRLHCLLAMPDGGNVRLTGELEARNECVVTGQLIGKDGVTDKRIPQQCTTIRDMSDNGTFEAQLKGGVLVRLLEYKRRYDKEDAAQMGG